MLISNVEVFFYILDIFIFLIFNNFDKVTFDNYIFKNFIFFYSWICEIILHFAEKLLKLYVTSTNREIAFIKKTLGEFLIKRCNKCWAIIINFSSNICTIQYKIEKYRWII